jgi:hypothetical protein
MNIKQIDTLNIGLLFLSAILAYNFPLQLFILSFAILGPLHYLTEINWLYNTSYHKSTNKNIWLFMGVISTFILVFPRLYYELFPNDSSWFKEVLLFVSQYSNTPLFTSIIIAVSFLFIPNKKIRFSIILLGFIIALLINQLEYYSIIIGLLIPTVIHVYIFTLIFMLVGALKTKSNFGYISFAIAMLLPLVFVFIDISQNSYLFSTSMKAIYTENGFHRIPVVLAKILGISDGKTFFFYEKIELRMMMFLSFIYLYHYLNWFSKTTTISWHKNLTLKSSIVIGVIWVVLLFLFYYNFRVGFLISLFFSFLHVILEFPLNVLSIKKLFS